MQVTEPKEVKKHPLPRVPKDTAKDEESPQERLQRAPRCTAIAKNSGKRCGMAAIRGGRVCVVHGGNAPQVQAAAKMRIAMLVDPALEVMFESLGPKQPPAIRLAAAKDILDRAGYKPVERSENINWDGDLSKLNEEQLEVVAQYFERIAFNGDKSKIEEARKRAMIEAGQVGPTIDVVPELVEKKDDDEWWDIQFE